MKKQNFNGNTNFWMILTIMLAVFIVLAGTVLIVTNPFSKNVPKDSSATAVVKQQTESDTENNDFATTKDRVTDVNDNYGQSIKSTYAGDNSTMEAMMKQRMFFAGVKSTLIVILLLAAILLVIVKCFNISLFKKKQADTVDAGEPEISAEDRKYVRRATEKNVKPKTVEKKPQNTIEHKEKAKKVKESNTDEKEVAEICQLP